MAKIIVLGDGKDADAAKAALDAAGVDCEIVKPSAANLLHIVIGMVDDEPEEKEEKDEKPPKDEKPDADSKDEPKDEAPADSDVQESLGEASIDGAVLEAVRGSSETSTLFVSDLTLGPRTTYKLNEDSTVSFWPADVAQPKQRMMVEHQKHRASTEVLIAKSATGKMYLEVGADLIGIFGSK